MGIEINRTRRRTDGTVACEVVFPNLGSYVRGTNELLQIEPRAYSAAEQLDRRTQWQAAGFKPELGPTNEELWEAKRAALERATGHRLPRASMPPYVTEDDGSPIKAGGTSSDDEGES